MFYELKRTFKRIRKRKCQNKHWNCKGNVQDLKSSMSFCGAVNEEKFVNIQSEITLIKDDIF